MPIRNLRFGLVLIGNALVAVSAFLSLGPYTSHDPSGLQYIQLDLAFWPAALAVGLGALLGFSLPRQRGAWADLTLAVGALFVTLLPELPWLNYGGAAISLLGTILAVALLLFAPVLTIAVLRWLGPLEASSS